MGLDLHFTKRPHGQVRSRLQGGEVLQRQLQQSGERWMVAGLSLVPVEGSVEKSVLDLSST